MDLIIHLTVPDIVDQGLDIKRRVNHDRFVAGRIGDQKGIIFNRAEKKGRDFDCGVVGYHIGQFVFFQRESMKKLFTSKMARIRNTLLPNNISGLRLYRYPAARGARMTAIPFTVSR